MMQSRGVVQRSVNLAAAATTALLLCGSAVTVGAATGPFDGLAGTWAGDGTITYSSGTKERLACRVTYAQSNPNNLSQQLRCAADSYNFQINANFDSANSKLSGKWAELVQNIAGSVSGTVANGKINGALQGPGFSASLAVVTVADKQTVDITTPMDQTNQIKAVSISVRKSK